MYQPLFDPNTQTLGSGFNGFGVPNGWGDRLPHVGAQGLTTQGPIPMGATPAIKDSSILAQYRMMNQMYGKSPQVDLSGITDWGSGIGKGVQNAMNMRMYNQQQAQQEAQMQQLGQDLQAQAEAKAQAEQQKFQNDVNSLVATGKYSQADAIAIALGHGEMLKPYVTQDANLQGKKNEFGWYQDVAQQYGPSVWATDKDGNPLLPNPQALTLLEAALGRAPKSYFDVGGQQNAYNQGVEQVHQLRTNNYVNDATAGFQIGQAGENLQSTKLGNQKTTIENQYLPEEKTLGIESTRLGNQGKTFDLEKKQNDAAIDTANKATEEADVAAWSKNPTDPQANAAMMTKHPTLYGQIMGNVIKYGGQAAAKNPEKALQGLAPKPPEQAPATLQLPQMPTAQQAGQSTRSVVGAGLNQLYNLPGTLYNNVIAGPQNYSQQFGQSLFGAPASLYGPQLPYWQPTPQGQ